MEEDFKEGGQDAGGMEGEGNNRTRKDMWDGEWASNADEENGEGYLTLNNFVIAI